MSEGRDRPLTGWWRRPAGRVFAALDNSPWRRRESKLSPSSARRHPGDSLGQSVAIDGNTIVPSAPQSQATEFPGPNARDVFVKPASGWADATQTAKLTTPDGTAGDSFGSSVAVSGHTAVASAPNAPVGGTPLQGAAYVFRGQRHPSPQ
jgi:FG-GAP repeat